MSASRLAASVAAALLAACGKGPDVPPAVPANAAATAPPHAPADARADAGIAWRYAASDAEVDAAFAVAQAEGKPLFLYWGAKWCPPCNQLQATLFNRQDFIQRSRAFVPVYVDGDKPGAQKLGSRFRVSGYPTTVLFDARGVELTRLPGEVDAARYHQVLDLGLNATRPVKALVADALAGRPLGGSDWRLLAYYSWDTDQEQLLGKDAVAPTLARLAAACPAELAETALRLRLKALALAADAKPAAKPVAAGRASVDRIVAAVADPATSRAQADLVAGSAADIVKALQPNAGETRRRVVAAFDAALVRLAAEPTLSRADRMQALISRVELARIDEPTPSSESAKGAMKVAAAPPRLPADLLAEVREQAARADREITDGYERQAVVTAAAHLLERAGLSAESDALLEANLAKSHSPYYLMSGLASNAKKRGDAARALHWSGLAYEKSEGPATRLQWGASHVAALIDLAPADEAAIEKAVRSVWREAMAQPDAFHQRSERSLQRIGRKLAAWNKGGAHAAALGRLRGELDSLCGSNAANSAKGPADPAACARLIDGKPAPAKA